MLANCNSMIFVCIVLFCSSCSNQKPNELSYEKLLAVENAILEPYYGDDIHSAEKAIKDYISYLERNPEVTYFLKENYILQNSYVRLSMISSYKRDYSNEEEYMNKAIDYSNKSEIPFINVDWAAMSDSEKSEVLKAFIIELDGEPVVWKSQISDGR